ncbi:hypothetical protein HDU92_003760 [Lobulomyces angularis]|nr:hypothetical protein HDU92_003760 [Lobulomyces angularis]
MKRASTFVQKLQKLLEDPINSQFISWTKDGSTFTVFKIKEFSEVVLPSIFRHGNYPSFLRQLNFYGFVRLNTPKTELDGPNGPHEFSHPFFNKNDTSRMHEIYRKSKVENNNTTNNEKIMQKQIRPPVKKPQSPQVFHPIQPTVPYNEYASSSTSTDTTSNNQYIPLEYQSARESSTQQFEKKKSYPSPLYNDIPVSPPMETSFVYKTSQQNKSPATPPAEYFQGTYTTSHSPNESCRSSRAQSPTYELMRAHIQHLNKEQDRLHQTVLSMTEQLNEFKNVTEQLQQQNEKISFLLASKQQVEVNNDNFYNNKRSSDSVESLDLPLLKIPKNITQQSSTIKLLPSFSELQQNFNKTGRELEISNLVNSDSSLFSPPVTRSSSQSPTQISLPPNKRFKLI